MSPMASGGKEPWPVQSPKWVHLHEWTHSDTLLVYELIPLKQKNRINKNVH